MSLLHCDLKPANVRLRGFDVGRVSVGRGSSRVVEEGVKAP
jgi:hypothetical protein